MKRIISKLFMAVLLAALTCGTAFAATAKVTYVKGKVEVNRGNAWVTVKIGDEIKESETISTGFQSEARLNYNGSVMAVPALSRVTLETLQSSDTKDTVSLKVDTGAVRSKVTHTEGKRIEYTARTSVAVASVRGTDYTVFSNGKVKVLEGAIAYYKASDYVPPAIEKVSDEEIEETDDTGDAGTAEGTGSVSGDSVADEGSATATTPAKEIAESSPKTSTVVGAGQTSTMGKTGTASKPVTEAKKRTTKAKTTVASAAKKDVITATISSSGGSTVEVTTPSGESGGSGGDIPAVKTGKIKLGIQVEEEHGN